MLQAILDYTGFEFADCKLKTCQGDLYGGLSLETLADWKRVSLPMSSRVLPLDLSVSLGSGNPQPVLVRLQKPSGPK